MLFLNPELQHGEKCLLRTYDEVAEKCDTFALMKLLYIVTFGLLTLGTACKESPTTPTVSYYTPEGFTTGGITPEMTDELLKNADHIDYIFTVIPLSMNQEGQSSVYQDVRYLSNTPLDGIISGCEPLARKIYLGNGEIIVEADLYFSNGCMFQVFISDEKPLFGNFLSQEGIGFYGNLMEQAKQSMPANLRNSYQVPTSN